LIGLIAYQDVNDLGAAVWCCLQARCAGVHPCVENGHHHATAIVLRVRLLCLRHLMVMVTPCPQLSPLLRRHCSASLHHGSMRANVLCGVSRQSTMLSPSESPGRRFQPSALLHRMLRRRRQVVAQIPTVLRMRCFLPLQPPRRASLPCAACLRCCYAADAGT
jgi:hypothetical protein